MVSGRRLRIGAWLGVLACSLAGVQGCILDGDASLGNDGTSAGTGGADAGKTGKAGGTAATSGGTSGTDPKSGTGGKAVVPSSGEGGAELGMAGVPGTGGEQGGGVRSEICELPIETGPCDAAIPVYGFDRETGKCQPFVYGGCDGNANNFPNQTRCQSLCEPLACPSHLQTDTVYEVWPLNRPERACVNLDQPIVVSCSMLLDPSLTVPTGYGQDHCVKRDGQLYFAGTTLPKADGWQDCDQGESQIVALAPDCRDL